MRIIHSKGLNSIRSGYLHVLSFPNSLPILFILLSYSFPFSSPDARSHLCFTIRVIVYSFTSSNCIKTKPSETLPRLCTKYPGNPCCHCIPLNISILAVFHFLLIPLFHPLFPLLLAYVFPFNVFPLSATYSASSEFSFASTSFFQSLCMHFTIAKIGFQHPLASRNCPKIALLTSFQNSSFARLQSWVWESYLPGSSKNFAIRLLSIRPWSLSAPWSGHPFLATILSILSLKTTITVSAPFRFYFHSVFSTVFVSVSWLPHFQHSADHSCPFFSSSAPFSNVPFSPLFSSYSSIYSHSLS